MSDTETVFIGKSTKPENLLLKLANRHGLITGATGTGKTVSLQILAEGFANHGVPVFCSDVKGDLSGIAAEGVSKDFLEKRAKTIDFDDYSYDAFPTIFWDLYGEQGHPIRTTVSEMGPLLLSRLMNLNDTQEGVLNIAFRVADEEGLLILDLKDLRSLIANVAERSKELSAIYGNVSKSSVGAIQRSLLVLEEQGGDNFFGEPALEIADLMRTTRQGQGYINILAADKLMQAPRLYATFLLWLLSELFEEMPEVGDPDKPKLVFFFDEAHLLFDEAPKALVEKVEQVVRLIRSKGRRGLFCDPESVGCSRYRIKPAGQQDPACLARLHSTRAARGQGGGGNIQAQSRLQDSRRNHGIGCRRGARLYPEEKRRAVYCPAHPGPPAIVATRTADVAGTQKDRQYEPSRGAI